MQINPPPKTSASRPRCCRSGSRDKGAGKAASIVSTPEPPQAPSAKAISPAYEQDRDEPINDRQRMLMNLIAVAIVVR